MAVNIFTHPPTTIARINIISTLSITGSKYLMKVSHQNQGDLFMYDASCVHARRPIFVYVQYKSGDIFS